MTRLASTGLALMVLVLAGCQQPENEMRSVTLTGGAYVRIPNSQIIGESLDSTSLGIFSADSFSVEIWAAGATLEADILESPALFMIGDEQGQVALGIYREPFDSSAIYLVLGQILIDVFNVPGCDWDDPTVFTSVAVTYDDTVLTVYGNGEKLDRRSVNVDLDVADSDALIGAVWGDHNDPATLRQFWEGAIDEVRIWRRVLPESEMAFRAANPDKLTKNYSPTGLDPLVGLWRFNTERTSGDLEPDVSGKGNDASLNAGAGQLAFSARGASTGE